MTVRHALGIILTKAFGTQLSRQIRLTALIIASNTAILTHVPIRSLQPIQKTIIFATRSVYIQSFVKSWQQDRTFQITSVIDHEPQIDRPSFSFQHVLPLRWWSTPANVGRKAGHGRNGNRNGLGHVQPVWQETKITEIQQCI